MGEEKNETENKTEEKSGRSMSVFFFLHKGELISMTTLAREG